MGLSSDEIFNIKNNNLTEEEKELLKYFRNLPKEQQQRELGRLEAKSEQYQNSQGKSSESKIG